jgi:hypothetical protein
MCTDGYTRRLPGYTHISIPVCTMCPYIPTYIYTCVFMSTSYKCSSDVDVVIYICTYIYRYTEARPSMPSHRYTHVYPSTRTRMHEDMATDERRWGRRCAFVWASRHPYMPGCTSVDTDAHREDGSCAGTDMHGGGSARQRPATPPRSPPHQRRAVRPNARRGIWHARASARRAHEDTCMGYLHVHIHVSIRSHRYIHP